MGDVISADFLIAHTNAKVQIRSALAVMYVRELQSRMSRLSPTTVRLLMWTVHRTAWASEPVKQLPAID